MPCRNAAAFLPATAQSLRQQSYPHWELLVIDDHSADSSAAFWEQQALADPRIRPLRNRGQGIISALQQGLEEAQGEFVGRVDADDLYPENRLALLVHELKRQGPGVLVTGTARYFSEDAVSPGYRQYQTWLNSSLLRGDSYRQVYRECGVASPNWLLYRADLEALGGFAPLDYPEDYDLYLRGYAAGLRLAVVPQLTLLWREHPLRSSRRSSHYGQKQFFRLKLKRFLEFEQPQQLILWGARRKGKLSAKILGHLGQDFRWMELAPERYPQPIYGKEIEDYRNLNFRPQQKLLISVYPPADRRAELADFLNRRGLYEGQSYWYL